MKRISAILGNTSCRIAMMDELESTANTVLTHARLREPGALGGVLQELNAASAARDAVLCSVVPELDEKVLEALSGVCPGTVKTVDAAGVAGFRERYATPETLGADRLCGALAAKEEYGAPCAVVDFGTATTVNVVNAEGEFLGGSIAPGIETGFRVLHERTAGLPDAAMHPPRDIIGATTEECIRSGVIGVAVYALRGIVHELRDRLGADMPVILTGGNAPLMLRAGLGIKGVHHEPELLFRGSIFYLRLSA